MLRVITVADRRFLREAGHLQRSLLSSNQNAHLTIYCDDKTLFAGLLSERCDVVELPDMPAQGAKRSKLEAFRHAIERGSFLYLDADAIVLEPLDELSMYERLSGCSDDLSHCPYIEDKLHPWPNAPELRRDVYINSGIFYAPASRKPLFEELCKQSKVDAAWERYIFAGRLYDNHFFCALLNLHNEPVRFLDPQLYGWQGFLYNGQVQVERRGEQLVNKLDGRPLKIVLFAGVRQSYDFIVSLPPDVASLLLQRILPAIPDSEQGLAAYLASVSSQFAEVEDPHVLVVLRQTIAEMRHLVAAAGDDRWRKRSSYFDDPEAMRAFACAQPSSQSEWNGLKCGGAYLEGEEYAAIRDLVRALDIRTVVETGAGETSILFADLGVKAVSVESQPGPWLERARARGCTVLEVPFNESEGAFAESELQVKLQATGLKQADMLFIDSPVGTWRRRKLLPQFMGRMHFRYVLYHDAVRDAVNIFRDQQQFGLRPVRFLDSVRGLVLLESPANASNENALPVAAAIDPLRVRVFADGEGARVFRARSPAAVRLTVENHGAATLSSNLEYPVVASYHWLDGNGQVAVFDGIRTPLPFDISAGDRCTIVVDVLTPDQPGEYTLRLSLVQEQLFWFHDKNPACLASIPLKIEAS